MQYHTLELGFPYIKQNLFRFIQTMKDPCAQLASRIILMKIIQITLKVLPLSLQRP